ncbi:MAG: EAL domain-containing protein [Gammaproteobacteria bacterium]
MQKFPRMEALVLLRNWWLSRLLVAVGVGLAAVLPVVCACAQGTAASPFRFYTVQDGLNQRLVQAFEQDQHGFIWLATWGGVNRFDGRSFESLTTRQGLRVNGSTAMHVDASNALWVGDTGGGLTLVENGRPVRTYAPREDRRSPVRALATSNDVLYLGFQSLGAARLDLNDPMARITPLPGLAGMFVRKIAPTPSGEILLLTVNQGLFVYTPGGDANPRLVDAQVTAIHASEDGVLAVGSRDGRIGLYRPAGILWRDADFGDRVTDLAFDSDGLAWVSTRTSIVPADAPHKPIPVNGPGRLLLDRDGILWVLTSSGLGRYLGERFTHYPLEVRGTSSIVYAIASDAGGRYWFGTGTGLLMTDADGQLVDVNEALGLRRCEVRDLKILPDANQLWMGCVRGQSQRIDLATMTPSPVFGEQTRSVLALARDASGWIWAGTPFGELIAEHPQEAGTRRFEFGQDKPIYSLAAGSNGMLWIAVQNHGIYRMATNQPDAEPEQVLSVDDLGGQSPMHLAIRQEADGNDLVWIGTLGGTIALWQSGSVDLTFSHEVLARQSIYALVPLPDNTLAIGTERGLYRYDLTSANLDFYGADEGFKGIETKNHASFLEDSGTLWVGTAAGATRMDLELPMDNPPPPPPTIVAVHLADQAFAPNDGDVINVVESTAVIEFAAVSTRAAKDIEFSHRMLGMDPRWSTPSAPTSVTFGRLLPGNMVFEVRARRGGEQWSEPMSMALRVPTPYWQTLPFRLACAAALFAACAGLIRLRTLRVERNNVMLQRQVDERTRSIAERTEQLRREMEEREKAELAREEMEDRFQRAYQNSPLGMALVTADGRIFDLNPQMRAQFWPTGTVDSNELLPSIIAPPHRDEFEAFLVEMASADHPGQSREFACLTQRNENLVIVFTLSPIRGPEGVTRYFLVMTQDVTQSREMTRQLEYQASFDELTGLHNRRSFATRLERAFAASMDNKLSYLLAIDLDRFKVVNDTCGHPAGDDLLVQVAALLRGSVRDTDVVARNGGDEFSIILLSCEESVARKKAELVRRCIAELRFAWGGQIFRIGASIGVARIDARANTLEELTMLADSACYTAKKEGRNRVHFATDEMEAVQEQREEIRWVQRLPLALERDEYRLYGQRLQAFAPAADNAQHIEVLLRLYDPAQNRMIPPGAFFPVVERYGLSRAIDEWVVRRTIAIINSHTEFTRSAHRFWINLSGASLSDPRFCPELRDVIEDAGLPPGTLNFEITETTAMHNQREASNLIGTLRDVGCEFALDDFGSGSSSFGYLKTLDVNYVKIDGHFVRNIARDQTDRLFVKSIIDIAHSLGMKVVAEFVEDDEVGRIAEHLGADYGQGFALHRPESIADLSPMRRVGSSTA